MHRSDVQPLIMVNDEQIDRVHERNNKVHLNY